MMEDLRARLIALLRKDPTINQLPEIAIQDLVANLSFREVHGGNIIVREGDALAGLSFLASGRLRVTRRDQFGNLLLYNEILPGHCIGETAMVLGQPSTADIVAVRNSILADLNQNDFEQLLKKHPTAIYRTFSQYIYKKLRFNRVLEKNNRAQSFVIVPLYPDVRINILAEGLAETLKLRGRTSLIPAGWAKDEISRRQVKSENIPRINLDELEAENDYLIYEADSRSLESTLESLRFADQIIFVANADSNPMFGAYEQALMNEPGFSVIRKHLVLLYPEKANFAHDLPQWRIGRDVERIYPTRFGNTGDFARLARFLVGHAVGVVLGGGGARGFAHLGVLRAIEEAKIPVDILGGNSMGALIGASYAFGVPREEIHHQILRFTKRAAKPGFPMISILSNGPYANALKQVFGDTLIESLWLPYFVSACNLSQARTVVLDKGPLWQAILASNSPAGVLPPVVMNGDLLVDGAILENVPVSAMRTRMGAPLEHRRGNGTVIAIDVDVRENLNAPDGVSEIKMGDLLKSLISRSTQRVPGIIDILLQAGHIGGLAQRDKIIAMADYYLEPPVSKYPMMGYKNANEIIDLGYRYASEQIAKWDPVI